MGMAIKPLESTGYSDRIAGEETRSCAAIKSLGVDADQMDTAMESLVDRDATAGVHGCWLADVWLMYGCCNAVVCLLYLGSTLTFPTRIVVRTQVHLRHNWSLRQHELFRISASVRP